MSSIFILQVFVETYRGEDTTYRHYGRRQIQKKSKPWIWPLDRSGGAIWLSGTQYTFIMSSEKIQQTHKQNAFTNMLAIAWEIKYAVSFGLILKGFSDATRNPTYLLKVPFSF